MAMVVELCGLIVFEQPTSGSFRCGALDYGSSAGKGHSLYSYFARLESLRRTPSSRCLAAGGLFVLFKAPANPPS
jgi:hypothetical protein